MQKGIIIALVVAITALIGGLVYYVTTSPQNTQQQQIGTGQTETGTETGTGQTETGQTETGTGQTETGTETGTGQTETGTGQTETGTGQTGVANVYPMVALTANNDQNYIASASSVFAGFEPFMAFDDNPRYQSFWSSEENRYNAQTGQYTGNIQTTSILDGQIPIAGEWLQIELPVTIRPMSFLLTGRSDFNLAPVRSPRYFVFLAGKPGTSGSLEWKILYDNRSQTPGENNWTLESKTFTVNTTNEKFKFFRLIVTQVGNDTGDHDSVQIKDFQILGVN
jgi:hypothetical protein